MNVDKFAKQLAKDVLAGASGPIWRGNMAGATKFVSTYMPTFVLVSCRVTSVSEQGVADSDTG